MLQSYFIFNFSNSIKILQSLQDFYHIVFIFHVVMFMIGETEEEYSTRLANNLESLILKEGPETVSRDI